MVVDQLSRLGKGELICLLLFTCNNVVSVRRGFLSFWVLGMGYVIHCGTLGPSILFSFLYWLKSLKLYHTAQFMGHPVVTP